MNLLEAGPDGAARCPWGVSTDDYITYHDHEWGMPVADDRRLFEKICLEGFQSGLSWLTILRKRDDFRRVFLDFDFERVARFDESDVERLLQDASIVRHRGKIEATINNARRLCNLVDAEGSFAAYIWRFEPDPSPPPEALADVPAQTATSKALSKDLKKRGFRFVGPTTAYAFMQAMGLVNDHLEGCCARAAVEAAREQFERPT